jgi:hypothetical protein
MHVTVKSLIGVIVVVGVVLAFSTKNEGNFLKRNPPPPALHVYYYYPKANFYYDSTAEKYICWDSSSSKWNSTDKLPVQQADLGKTVRIGHVETPVWKENQHHRLIYSVSLYSSPSDFKEEEKPNPKSYKKTTDIDSASQDVEKKSGVRKFFERIFPPKKKKDSLK